MKKTICIPLLCLISVFCISQNVFNRIIYDTIAHLNPSVVVLDTGYVVMSGTGTTGLAESDIRCFALSYINMDGERQWIKRYTDYQNEYWEGWSNSFKKNGDISYTTGGITDLTTYNEYIYIYIYDSLFNIKNYNTYDCNFIFKRTFNIIQVGSKAFYLVGQVRDQENKARLLLMKVDEDLSFQWEKTMPMYDYEYGGQIIETKEGDLLIGGASFNNATGQEFWYLVKTDTLGNVLWKKTYGRNTLYNDGITGLVETKDSCYLACGGYPLAGRGSNTSIYFWDGCLRKIDKNGNLLWEKLYRSYSKMTNPNMAYIENFIYSIAYKNNDLYVLGTNRINNGASRGYLQKINEYGDICWHRDYYAIDESTTYQWLKVLQPTPDNGFILGGHGNEYDWQGYSPPQQMWLVKTDSLGVDGLCYTEPPALNIDIDIPDTVICNSTFETYMYISGKSAPYTINISTGQQIDSIYYPFRFVPVEIGLGEVEARLNMDIYFIENITEATITNHEWGQCIVKPVTIETPEYRGHHELEITVTDVYGETKTITKSVFAKGDCDSYVSDDQSYKNFRIFPNPVTDKVYIEFYDHSKYSCGNAFITLYTPDGKHIQSRALTSMQTIETLDITHLSDGIYILEINDCYGNKTSEKITKQ
jgi:hypothetical protein